MEDPRKMEEGLGEKQDGSKVFDDIEKKKKEESVDDHEHEKEEKVGEQKEKEKLDDHELVMVKKMDEQVLQKPKNKRIATLDAFRGLTIVLMILVDDAGGVYARIDHSPWNGCTLADFVLPFFLFIVGVAIALALKKVPKKRDAVKKIVIRTVKMLFWGILLQGGYSHAPNDLNYGVDMKHIRWCGILQRIALVYLFVALIETFTVKLRPVTLAPGHFSIFKGYRWQWLGGFVAFLIYMVTTYALYVPDWSYYSDSIKYTVKCGMRGHLGPACNAVGHVDRQVWGINHIYKYPVWERLKACTLNAPSAGPYRDNAPTWCRAPFEPEGLLSSISAIITGTIGIHYGHVLIHYKDHADRLKHWVSMGLALFIIAIILHFTDAIPINKQLYSFSYVCFTGGAAGIVFSALYIVIDVLGYRTPFIFLEWIGMNAMLVFVMAAQGIFAAFINGWYYEKPSRTLVHWIEEHVFINVWKSQRVGTLLYVIFCEIVFWSVISGILHKLGIYWKL